MGILLNLKENVFEIFLRLGRRPVLLSALTLQVAAGLAAAAAPSYLALVAARFLLGATVPGAYLVGYVLGNNYFFCSMLTKLLTEIFDIIQIVFFYSMFGFALLIILDHKKLLNKINK